MAPKKKPDQASKKAVNKQKEKVIEVRIQPFLLNFASVGSSFTH